jgi:hypothetical protein
MHAESLHPYALPRHVVERLGGKFPTHTLSVDILIGRIEHERAKAKKPLSMKPTAIANRALRRKYREAGLNSEGKPFSKQMNKAVYQAL